MDDFSQLFSRAASDQFVPSPDDFGRLPWDFRASRWGLGALLVSYGAAKEPTVAYAPPGTSLRGESGLDTACWRRAAWTSETAFVANERPETLVAVDFDRVHAELPHELRAWAEHETVAHVERLRRFVQRRPGAVAVRSAATVLKADLDRVAPEAFEQYCVTALEESLACEPEPEPVEDAITTHWRRSLYAVGNFALLALLYIGYRTLLRPDDAIASGMGIPDVDQLRLGTLASLPLWIYAAGHVVLPFLFLAWLFARRPDSFNFVRNAILFAAGFGIIGYLLIMPDADHRVAVTPPRWVPGGAVPTMPAVHLAIAIVIAWTGFRLARSRAMRAAAVAYPVLVVYVIAASNPSWIAASVLGAELAVCASWIAASGVGAKINAWCQPSVLAITGSPQHDG
jgi:hypothetical protein